MGKLDDRAPGALRDEWARYRWVRHFADYVNSVDGDCGDDDVPRLEPIQMIFDPLTGLLS